MVNNIYKDINIVNVNEYYKFRQILAHFNGYLPCMLRRLIGQDYYYNVFNSENKNEIYVQIKNSNIQTRKEKIEEFITWCNENNYDNLVNQSELIKLRKKIKEIDKEFLYLKKKNLIGNSNK